MQTDGANDSKAKISCLQPTNQHTGSSCACEEGELDCSGEEVQGGPSGKVHDPTGVLVDLDGLGHGSGGLDLLTGTQRSGAITTVGGVG